MTKHRNTNTHAVARLSDVGPSRATVEAVFVGAPSHLDVDASSDADVWAYVPSDTPEGARVHLASVTVIADILALVAEAG